MPLPQIARKLAIGDSGHGEATLACLVLAVLCACRLEPERSVMEPEPLTTRPGLQSSTQLIFGVFSENLHVSVIEFERQVDDEILSFTNFPPGLTRKVVSIAPGEYCWVRIEVDLFNSGYYRDALEEGAPLADCFTIEHGQRFVWGVIRFANDGLYFDSNPRILEQGDF